MTSSSNSPRDLLHRLVCAVERLERRIDSSPWMTVEEAAGYLRWPVGKLYGLTASKAIPHRRHGKRIVLHRGEVDEWLDNYHEGPRVAAT